MVSTVVIPIGSIDAALTVNWIPIDGEICIHGVSMDGEELSDNLTNALSDDITDEIEKQLDAKNIEEAL